MVAVAQPFVDEGGGFVLHHLGDAFVEFGYVENLVLPGEGANQLVQFVDESQRIDVFQQEFAGVVEAFAVRTVLLDVGEYGLQ